MAGSRFQTSETPRLAPSILDSDLARLAEQVEILEGAGIEVIHVDVMDGHFAPNLSIGIPLVSSLRKATNLVLDVHLMIDRPERYVEQFIDAGADIVTVHAEATTHIHRAIDLIRGAGAIPGVAINPGTPVAHATELVPIVDLMLIMSVNPGFGGQKFIPNAIPRLQAAQAAIQASGRDVVLEVDGGVNGGTIASVVEAGADLVVAGSAIFRHEHGPAKGVAALQDQLRSLGSKPIR